MALRDALKVGGVVAMAAVMAGAVRWVPVAPAPKVKAAVTLVYVGADDCAPCRAWQLTERKQLQPFTEFARLNYREVKSPTLRDVLKDEHWPEDLRSYRDRLGRGVGVPLWLVILGDEVVARGFGASQWHAAVLPRVKSLLH